MITVINAINPAYYGIAETLINTTVRIGTTEYALNGTQCGSVTSQMISTSPMLDFTCNPPISGQYVTLLGQFDTSVCEVRVYGQNITDVQSVSEELNPISIWPLNTLCGINDTYSSGLNKWDSKQYNFISDKYSIIEGAIEFSTAETLTAAGESGGRDVDAMSMTVYVHPFANSSGGFALWMSSTFSIRLAFMTTFRYMCEVVVRCNGAEVMQVYTLKPYAWTFLGLTFDGHARKMVIWRDGEIVRMINTSFDVVHMNFGEVMLTPITTGAHMGFSRLQLFDRVLTEVEMKASRDDKKVLKCSGGFGMFQTHGMANSTEVVPESYRITTTTLASRILCARVCLRERTCLSFVFRTDDKRCDIYWSNDLSTSGLEIISGYYKWINPYG